MKRILCTLVALSTSLFAQLPNGEPAGAVPIGLGINPDGPAGISGNVFSNAGEAEALSAGLPAFSCGSGHNSDVFYAFTAPNSAVYTFATCTPAGFTAGTHTDTVLQVLNDTLTTQLGCDDDACAVPNFNSQVAVVLTAGQNVVLRLASWSGVADGSYYLSVSESFPPANDDCTGAIAITDGVVVNGTTIASLPSNPSPTCGSFTTSNPDVWYTYTPATSGTVRVVRSASLTRMAAYTGACGALLTTASACTAANQMVFDVVAGTQYFIRVGVATAASSAAFQITIEAPVATTAGSNACATAAAVSTGVTASSTVGATASSPSPSCASFTTTNPDVWFQYTAPAAGLAIVTPSADGEGATRMAIYTTPDCVTFTNVTGTSTCTTITTSGTTAAQWTTVPGTTYYIRFGVVSATTASPFLFNLGFAPFEPNDTCSGAVAITTGVNGPFSNLGTTTGNDVGFNTPCGVGGNVGGRDLFYTYTPACDGVVTMTTCGGNAINEPGVLADTQLVVYDNWTCGVGPGAPAVACNDDAGGALCGASGFESTVTFNALAGVTYLVRVAGFGGAIGTFNLTVTLSTAQIAVIGTGCGSPTAATLAGSGAPVMGSTGTITVTAQPNANGLLLFSNPNTAMAYTPFGACTIYLENPGMGILLPIFTDGTGVWSLTVTFPIDPALDCVGWDFQGLVIGAAGIEFTNALRLILGT
jgi:hypothetical protein